MGIENFKLDLSVKDISPAIVEIGNQGLMLINKERYELNSKYFTGKPSRVSFRLDIASADDFLRLVDEYREVGTKIFYNNLGITAILDYSGKDRPEHHERIIDLKFRQTSEYAQFSRLTNHKISQEDFILFLKELEPFITNIDSMTLIETAENLRICSDVGSKMEYDKNSQSYSFEVKSGKKGGKLPDNFKVKLPMYLPTIDLKTEFNVICRYAWSERSGFEVTLFAYGKERIERDSTDIIVADLIKKLDLSAYRTA